MGVGRKFSKHPTQTLCVTAEETEAQREEGRFLALSTLSVKSQGYEEPKIPGLIPSGSPH